MGKKSLYRHKVYILLLFLDIGCLLVSYALCLGVAMAGGAVVPGIHSRLLALQLAAYICTYYLGDIYEDIYVRGYYKEFLNILRLNAFLMVVTLTALFFTGGREAYSQAFLLYFFLINILLNYACRSAAKKWLLPRYRKSKGSQKMMVITTAKRAEKTLNKLFSQMDWAYYITSVAVIDEDWRGKVIRSVPVVANYETLYDGALEDVVDTVLINVPSAKRYHLSEMMEKFYSMGVTIHVTLSEDRISLPNMKVDSVCGFVAVTSQVTPMTPMQGIIKRTIDIIGGMVGLVFTGILTLFLAPAIKLESKGPVFFSQDRVGKNGRIFRISKFRSMYADAEERKKELMEQNEMQGHMFKMEHDPRVTKIGAFIRKTSLDEFPQFWNVLKGEMSLVGTRPPTVDEFKHYDLHHKKRLSMKPGLTGLWQISGRSDITNFEDVVKMDTEYIENWGIGEDIRILLKTVLIMFTGRGAR